MKCVISSLYGKDENKELHFYCEFCGKAMGYDEERECKSNPEKCPVCGNLLGSTDFTVGTCLKCDNLIK